MKAASFSQNRPSRKKSRKIHATNMEHMALWEQERGDPKQIYTFSNGVGDNFEKENRQSGRSPPRAPRRRRSAEAEGVGAMPHYDSTLYGICKITFLFLSLPFCGMKTRKTKAANCRKTKETHRCWQQKTRGTNGKAADKQAPFRAEI